MLKYYTVLILVLGTGLSAGAENIQLDIYTIDTVPKESQSGPITFERKQITTEDLAESATFGDFNDDEIVDIAVGNNWFQGPDFTQQFKFRVMQQRSLAYTPDDFTLAIDVDTDGYEDIVSAGHDYGLFWYKNPGEAQNGLWERFLVDGERPPNGNIDTNSNAYNIGYHAGRWYDVDGDGNKRELISTGAYTGGNNPMTMRWWEIVDGQWVKNDLGIKCYQWGSGLGDIDGDGGLDIVCPDAWLEAPLSCRRSISAHIWLSRSVPDSPGLATASSPKTLGSVFKNDEPTEAEMEPARPLLTKWR